MLKVALLASALLLAAPATVDANGVADSMAAAPEASCHPGQSFDLGCAMRVVDTDGDGTISAVELANLAVRLAPVAPIVDWTPLHPAHGTSLDFKDAAIEPGTVLPVTAEHELPQPLVPALFALGALVILLRSRPS